MKIYLIQSLKRLFFLFFALFSFSTAFTAVPEPHLEVLVPMRDGYEMPCSIYFPDGKPGKYPCILVRHPLGKELLDVTWFDLPKEGYMLAVQPTRSSSDKDGSSLPYVTDANDGFDSVEYIAASDWCTGQVATIGMSASGISSMLLGSSEPPHLTCQYIEMAPPSLYQYAVRPGGQFRKEQVESWLKAHKRSPAVFQWLKEKTVYDDFWRQFNTIDTAANIKVPQVHVGGWYDIFLQGTLDAFQAACEHSDPSVRDTHRLIVGPWGHLWRYKPGFGDFEAIAKGKTPPQPIAIKDWLNAYVKGNADTMKATPRVQYYVMGPFDGSSSSGNEWKSAHKWPPDCCLTQLYLTKEGVLNTAIAPEQNLFPVSFDPENPVPTIGGRNLFMADGPKNLRAIEERKDVVTFTTAALEEDMEVTGRIAACIYANGFLEERDLCCRLTDVYPDGRSILVADGVAHVAAQKDGSKTQPVLVDLWSTSIVFAKGHSLRLVISGSNFPAYETSLQPNPTDSNICFNVAAGGETASYIALPVIKNLA